MLVGVTRKPAISRGLSPVSNTGRQPQPSQAHTFG
jgi:hypothetical protein